jgi:hypothetical protein
MRIFWACLIWFTLFMVIWVAFLRPWLRNKPGAQWFFQLPFVEWFEINVYKKSETIAWARYLTALGAVLTGIANADPATAQTMVQMFEPILPAGWAGVSRFIPMIITAAGLLAEYQRRDTTKPLAVVAMPSDAPIEVKEAVASAEIANADAAAAVEKAA